MAKRINFVTLGTERYCYRIEDSGLRSGTMTVGDLIYELKRYDEDAYVIFSNDNGYTYGRVRDSRISEEDYREEEDEE